MSTSIAAAFLLGLFGSAHCIGMCGAFVLGIGGVAKRSGRQVSMLTSYFSGKTLTYALLGAAAGGVGSLATTALGRFQSTMSIAVGVLLVVVGLGLLGYRTRFVAANRFYVAISGRTARLMKRRSGWSVFGLGAINGLLPCGLVYGGLLIAVSTASVTGGLLAMSAFGVATVPALAVVGWSVGLLDQPGLRRQLPRIGAAMVIVMGILMITRATPLMHSLHKSPAAAAVSESPPADHTQHAH